jgi:5-methylcytosine-specific restriction protein A
MSGWDRQKRNERIKLQWKYKCACCGRVSTDLEIDHIVPVFAGGSEDESNLQLLCAGDRGCHAVKSKYENGFHRLIEMEELRKLVAVRKK